MITKLYWATRILGYVACLGGMFCHLARMQNPTASDSSIGLIMVGIGFLFFFASYALRAWRRFGTRRRPSPPSDSPPSTPL
ncbi:MAG: hypothetical protein PHO14_08225 [Kiritimatiellae bacterium]|nr:hypothetical protein [Kiritimatiellia bacterium]MDD4342205.1 hypothetical protein [Kiritimatiellia bacterium]